MEEKRGTSAKGGSNSPQKLTYEQLNDACRQLFQQNQYLAKQLEERNMANGLKRLDCLFRVVEIYSSHSNGDSVMFDPAFVKSCIKEIQEAMTVETGKAETKDGE